MPGLRCMVAICMVLAGCRAAKVSTPGVDPARQEIASSVAALERDQPVVIEGQSIGSRRVLSDFYRRRDFALAWTDGDDVDELLHAVRDSAADGLEPADYHLGAIEQLRAAPSTPATRARLDLLLTDAAVLLGYHLRFGKSGTVHVDAAWIRDEPPDEHGMSVTLQRALDDGHVYEAFEGLKPRYPFYTRLTKALADYRRIAASGGWPQIPAGKRLEPGVKDPRVVLLRRRLGATGDVSADVASDPSPHYDAAVAAGVRTFQERHGLESNGVVGDATLHALDVPVGVRIDQIRATLERCRWVMQDLPERFVLVNVAGYRLTVIDREVPVWETRVIVGDRYTQTPSFRADMRSIVLNPTWTIPPGIMKNEIEPAMRRDPGYLQRKGYSMVDGQVVQPPGPKNALGRIKLLMPNRHHIYLHDTPSKAAFNKINRTFSHGCVRVENPFELAALALDEPKWTAQGLVDAASNGKTRTITLPRPLPVLILYWTAQADADGRVHFLSDVYDRDPDVIAALTKPVTTTTDVSASDDTPAADAARTEDPR